MAEIVSESGDTLNESYYCPITGALMVDPVIDLDGNSFERSAISEWLARRGLSPITRNAMSVADLVPNRALKDAIDAERGSLAAVHASAPPMDIDAEEVALTVPELRLRVAGIPYSDIDPSDTSGDSLFLSNIISPATEERTPTDIVVCIDISGSMQTEASAAGVESSGLSMLDIVKHAVVTIAEVLKPNDRLGVVAWSSTAKVVTELTSMSARGKASTISAVHNLDVDGMTNIWEGLKVGIELLDSRTDAIVGGLPGNSRNASVFLLTDGVPNVEPSRGYIPTMQRYKEQHGGKYAGIVNTFGFGYSLMSDLLSDYATEGGGIYAFIPDSGFVGTIFVNALANCLTTITECAVLSVSCDASDATVKSMSDGNISAEFGDGLTYNAQTIQNGQSYGSVVRVSGNADTSPADVVSSLKYRQAGIAADQGQKSVSARGSGSLAETSEADKQEVALEAFRYMAIEAISHALNNFIDNDISSGQTKILSTIALIKGYMQRHTEVPAENTSGDLGAAPASARKRLTDLLADLEGQVLEATSKGEYFKKWGGHFLRSIRCAHQQKQCNNFKDPGVQHYGNKMFTLTRDEADDAFSTLPPPVPKISPYSYSGYGGGGGASRSAPAAPASMSSFNRPDMVCFHGDAQVHTLNGTKSAKDVCQGDLLEGRGRVRCVVKTVVTARQADLVRLPGGLLVTPWHPVKVGGQWVFPVQTGTLEYVPCEAVYSFLVEKDDRCNSHDGWPFVESVTVDGVVCATLAHGIQGTPIVSHAFFGTHAVVKALQQCEGWASGLVTFQDNANGSPSFLVREPSSGLVVGFSPSMAMHA